MSHVGQPAAKTMREDESSKALPTKLNMSSSGLLADPSLKRSVKKY